VLRFASALAVLLALPSAASAQCTGLGTGQPSAYRFYVAPGAGSFLGVDATTIQRELEPSIALLLDYAHRPFALDDARFYTCQAGMLTGEELDVVGGMVTAQLTGALAFANVVQIGLNVPIVLYTWGDGFGWSEGSPPSPRSFPGGEGATLGDPRLSGKVRFFEIDLGSSVFFSMAAAAWLTFPTARAILPRRYAGEPNVSGGAHVIVGLRWQGLRTAVNLGFGAREDAQLIVSRRTSEMTWGVAAAYDFDLRFGVLAEIAGQGTFGTVYDDEAPTELRAAAYLREGDFTFTLGAGVGLGYAIGVPVFRVLGGAAWDPQPHVDSDSDGVYDAQDACPADAEDDDGHADEDGCPDSDDDGDEVPDATDRCPQEAEDVDEHEDEDGCPDPDDDGDGIRDGYDSCPHVPEDRDGDHDNDGCPDDDRDGDRIRDADDECPSQREDTDGLGDEDGCPETDFDRDRIPDTEDQCADRAEDRNGVEDGDGCPDGRTRRRRRPRR
jgi:hypothetical protein